MVQSTWPATVNQRFFGFNDQPENNVELTEFISGRVIGYQKNTKKIMKYKCSLKLKVKTELPAFWAWFNDTLGQTAGAFRCAALGTGYYRFSSTPSPTNTDTVYRILSMDIEEVF